MAASRVAASHAESVAGACFGAGGRGRRNCGGERLAGKNVLPAGETVSNLEQLKAFIDSFCSSNEAEVLQLALDVVGIPDEYKGFAIKRWEADGSPSLDEFWPYTTHVFKVDLLFYLGIYRGFISGDRASNRAGMAYLYYLPFCMVFLSGDRLHRRTVPLFLRDDQSYVHSDEFKAALRELDQHYDALPDEIKELGVMQFVSFPPSDIDSVVTRLWDKHMRPDWREIAREQEARRGQPRDEEAGQRTVADLRGRIEQARTVSDRLPGVDGAEPNYVIIRRLVPVKKGKWRMVSKEVEDAGDGEG
jgi:hypothetical protein